MLSSEPSTLGTPVRGRDLGPDRAAESKGRILILEQDRYSLERYADAFLDGGFAIAAACDEAGALRALGAGPFDVVVADVGSGDDGVLRAIRGRNLSVPVVLVMDPEHGPTPARAIEAGLVHRLVRPVPTDEVVRCAERAARSAQAAAHDGAGRPDPDQQEGFARERAELEALYGRALGSLYMTYQPILRTRDGSVFGWEALLRTREAGVKGPLEFLDLAERLDSVRELGRAIRANIARTARRTRGVMFFVNLHRDDLLDEELFALSSSLSSLAPDVVLEITERSPIDSVPDVHERVRRLRKLGFRLAIDDLGSGHATFSSFTSLAPDFVKIDRAIVQGIDRDPVKRDFVESLVSLSHEMGIPVVAEGIETAGEQQTATELGCDLMQGFLFRRPEELALGEHFQLAVEGWSGSA